MPGLVLGLVPDLVRGVVPGLGLMPGLGLGLASWLGLVPGLGLGGVVGA